MNLELSLRCSIVYYSNFVFAKQRHGYGKKFLRTPLTRRNKIEKKGIPLAVMYHSSFKNLRRIVHQKLHIEI